MTELKQQKSKRLINQSINQKRIRVTKVTNVTARPRYYLGAHWRYGNVLQK